MTKVNNVIDRLMDTEEPAIRHKVLVLVFGQAPDTAEVRRLQAEIMSSPLVRRLLSERDEQGRIPHHPYAKWDGAHWVLAQLADIGYPAGDEALIPLAEQVTGWLLGYSHQKSIRTIDGRVRRCASQEGNALYSLMALGLADDGALHEQVDELARRLVSWQWPDGGWNCDRRPEAANSSYHESLIPLRGLALHAKLSGNQTSRWAAEQAAEIFLKRRLYKRQADGRVIADDFVRLHYPPYWHYDVLIGLKVLTEAGFIGDPRCQDALDLLESKRLPDGGWPAEKSYYRVTDKRVSGRSLVDWGGASQRQINPWVTADALYVLRAAGRLT